MRQLPLKLIWALGAPALLAGCATIGPPQPPSLDLPKPPSDLRASRKGDRVVLTWTIPNVTTDRQTIRSAGKTKICRGLNPGQVQCGTPVAEIPTLTSAAKVSPQKSNGTYVDAIPPQLESDSPSSLLTYAIEVLNPDGRSAGFSNRVQVSTVRTLAPPQDFQARVTSEGVALRWTGQSPSQVSGVKYVYRVYRRSDDEKELLVDELPAADQRNFSLTDSEIDWQKNYEYRAKAVAVMVGAAKTPTEVEGDETPAVKVFANDVFPPAVPSGLQAVFSGPGQKLFVDLIWAPVTDVDLAGYNIYRHTAGTAPAKLNASPEKSPAYRDTKVALGLRYFYSVSAIDSRGNESAQSEEASERVP